MAFSGCDKDCAGARVNDLGFIASRKEGAAGYRVWAGGGMGAHSAKGSLLEECAPKEDAGYIAEAVKGVFYKRGDRRNKHRNRLRFLIQDIGFENFGKYYADEMKALKAARSVDNLRNVEFAGPSAASPSGAKDIGAGGDYRDFLEFNVVGQKQEGFAAVNIRIPRGDIAASAAEAVADLAEKFSAPSEIRVSQNQNLCVTNVRKGDVGKLFEGLKEAFASSSENEPNMSDVDFLYPDTLVDATVCKGAATCNLGLLNSPALARQLEPTLKSFRPMKRIFKGINIKINGCPNACARHPLGLVSFHGIVRRIDNRPAPFYKLLVGGGVADGDTRFAADTGILIPARGMPAFVKEFLTALERRISDGEDAATAAVKYAADVAGRIAPKYARVPSYEEDRSFYTDWGRDAEFSLEGTGPGECGAGIIDMIESDLIDAKIALDNAGESHSVEEIKKAVFYSARALLVVKGADPKTAAEAFADFKTYFVDTGISPSRYGGLGIFYDALGGDEPSGGKKAADIARAREFLAHINELYKNMDSSFEFTAAYKNTSA
jgi:sulfite reductase (ferredoxin)